MKRAVLAALLSLLILPALAWGDALHDSLLDRGVTNSDTYAYLLIRQARENKADAVEILQRAATYAPDLPAVYFALSGASLSFSAEGMMKSVDYLLQGVGAYSRNFWWSFTLTGSLFFSLILSFLFSAVSLIVIRLFTDLALLSHDFREGNLNLLVLPAFLVLSALSPLLFVGGLLMMLSLYMKKTDRTVAYLFLAFLLFFPVVRGAASRFVSAYASGTVRSVVRVNESQDNAYAISTLKDDAGFVPLFSYALALKREGHYDDAIAVYRKLNEKKPDPRVYVNLGNCYVGLYNFEESRKSALDEAIRDYQAAAQMKPLATAYYNLSEISREMLDFSKGENYFRSAISIDRAAVSNYRAIYSRNPNRVVVDETLPADKLWDFILSMPPRTSGFGLARIPALGISVLALLMLAALYLMDGRAPRRAYRCRKCGVILCEKCEKRLTWGQMCPQCYASLIKLDELDAKERVARLLSIYAKQGRRRTTLKVLSFVLPGSSQIYAGRILQGFLFLWPFLFFVILPFTNSFFVPHASAVSHSFFNGTAYYLAAVLYFISNLITRQRISRGWL